MSFNICRGTRGSLAMFTANRNASSRDSRFIDLPLRLVLEIEIGDLLAVSVLHDEGFLLFLDLLSSHAMPGVSAFGGRIQLVSATPSNLAG
jgi:hypothetical protein